MMKQRRNQNSLGRPKQSLFSNGYIDPKVFEPPTQVEHKDTNNFLLKMLQPPSGASDGKAAGTNGNQPYLAHSVSSGHIGSMSMHHNGTNKMGQTANMAHTSAKKYMPNFPKPDLETLLAENQHLKKAVHELKQQQVGQKLRIHQLETRVKFFEGVQKKIGLKEQQERGEDDFMLEDVSGPISFGDKNSLNISSSPSSGSSSSPIELLPKRLTEKKCTSLIYTDILKNKIHDLSVSLSAAESQIQQLKKLPHITVFEENDVEKQLLFQQTVRLKAVIASLTMPNEDQSFQTRFLRMVKQENEKLKANIRFLENQRALLKAKQSIQAKCISDLRKQIGQLARRLKDKGAELVKANNDNKNLLFKKTSQLLAEQQKRQNLEKETLQQHIAQLEDENRVLQSDKQALQDDNLHLKEKELKRANEFSQLEYKFQLQLKNYQEQIEQLQQELICAKEGYKSAISSQSYKRRRSKKFSQQSKGLTTKNEAHQLVYYKPVKPQDIELAVLILDECIAHGRIDLKTLDALQAEEIQNSQLHLMLCSFPFNIPTDQAFKLTRYLSEDNSQSDKVIYDQLAHVNSIYVITCLRAMISRLRECDSHQMRENWCLRYQRSRNLARSIEELKGKYMKKAEFVQLVLSNTKQALQVSQIAYICLHCFAREQSEQDIVLSGDKIKMVFEDAAKI